MTTMMINIVLLGMNTLICIYVYILMYSLTLKSIMVYHHCCHLKLNYSYLTYI